MARLMHSLGETPLANVKVYGDDATRVLDWLPPGSIDAIDLLLSRPVAEEAALEAALRRHAPISTGLPACCEPGGRFRFASDIDSYVNWTLAALPRAWRVRMARPAPPTTGASHIRTGRAPAMRQRRCAKGRRPAYLTFRAQARRRLTTTAPQSLLEIAVRDASDIRSNQCECLDFGSGQPLRAA